MPEVTFLGGQREAAAVEPALEAGDGRGRADDSGADGAYGCVGGVCGAVVGDAMSWVYVAGAAAELQWGLVKDGDLYGDSLVEQRHVVGALGS